MRFAGMDVGTNSVLLTVARVVPVEGQSLEIEHERCVVTRLGQGLGAEGDLAGPAMDRTLAELAQCAEILSRCQAQARAAGTSALRRARNGPEFLQQAREILGFPLELLSGEEEARLGYLGALSGLVLPADQPSALVIDPGGGSTEVFLTPRDVRSYEVGAVRLTEEFFHHDPPQEAEISLVRQRLRRVWEGLASNDQAPLVAVGGSATTLAALDAGLSTYSRHRVHGRRVGLARVRDLRHQLARVPLAQRQQWPCLPPERADIIVAGALIVEELVTQLQRSEVIVSDGGLRFGLIEELRTAAAKAAPENNGRSPS